MKADKIIFLGRIISPEPTKISILNGYMSVENGKITSKGTASEYETFKQSIDLSEYNVISMSESQFLLPGLIDCHVHAPQFPNLGLGLDRPLLEWLNRYTFPLEKRYSDVAFAKEVYDTVVRRLLINGTTTACYFGSLHLQGTLQLAASALRTGQRALVGKVSMNAPNEWDYYNDTEREIRDSEEFVKAVLALKNDLVQPIITPRFAISCDAVLLKALAALADKYNLRIQTHLSENTKEIEVVLDMYKGAQSYTEVYDKHGIITDKTVLAHAIHLSPAEMSALGARGASVAHCPASNTRLASGLCPVRALLARGVSVGLGTDVSGGDSASVLDAARRCLDVSAHRQLSGERGAALTWQEALYLATLGGATALGLSDRIGDFTVGKDLDALLIDVYQAGGPVDRYQLRTGESDEDHSEGLVQRFFYVGDDRNIRQVFVKGVERKMSLL